MLQYNPYETLMILTAEREQQGRDEHEWFRQAVEQQSARSQAVEQRLTQSQAVEPQAAQSQNIRTRLSTWFGRFLIDTGERIVQHVN